jgi:uncharacterized membrane protein
MDILWLLLYLFFCYLMFNITIQYIPYDTDVAFLRIKQSYIDIDHWRVAFFIHVYASMFSLLAGMTQFSRWLLRHYPVIHRRLGMIYVITVLFVSSPSGLVMGFYANGGIFSRIAFVLLSILWFYFTWQAWRLAMKGDYKKHRQFMIRSFALTLSAITLRAWKFLIMNNLHVPPMDVYRFVAWWGWGFNWLIAEWILWREKK